MRVLCGIVTAAIWVLGVVALGNDGYTSATMPGLIEAGSGGSLRAGVVPIEFDRIEPVAVDPEAIGPGPVVLGSRFEQFERSGQGCQTAIESEETFSATCLDQRPRAWYVRLDAFHWNEQVDSEDFADESGVLTTIGYERRVADSRFRLELFGGSMDYDGHAQDGYHLIPYEQASGTDYIGCRGELEYLLEPRSWTHTRIVLGIGTRLWQRRLHNGTLASGDLILGYDETWWTLYPYIGIETKERVPAGRTLRLFGASRFGLTPFTHEDVSLGPALRPRCGTTAQFELGLRNERFVASVLGEIMTWDESLMVDGYYQPYSSMATLGCRFVYRF